MGNNEQVEVAKCPKVKSGIHAPWNHIVVDKDYGLQVGETEGTARHVRWITKEVICKRCGLLLSTGHYTEVIIYALEDNGLTRVEVSNQSIAGNHEF